MLAPAEFRLAFSQLTGAPGPFPWQEKLYVEWFAKGTIPSSCVLPTGLGKTNVIAVWLIALAHGAQLPRRLVYVVNRRTVVDQTTNEAEKLRENLNILGIPGLDSISISTLRGQFRDNREWSTDPSRPAIITGTVDMVGSRLLFSGYGVGFKAKPLHAAFLGQDALIVHDEAHLEPAFQKLIERIAEEQARGGDRLRLRVMELTATTRGAASGETFQLTDEEQNPPEFIPGPSPAEPSIYTVWRRLASAKKLVLSDVEDDKDAAKEMARKALAHKDKRAAVLIFARTIDAVMTIAGELEKTKRAVLLLTGTMRGKERDALMDKDDFRRFGKNGGEGDTVYLVCTSAGEVGIDISADHMVCDLSTWESMAQRFGRVNRYGLRADAHIDVVYPLAFEENHKLTPARRATLLLVQELKGDASPRALGRLRDRCAGAYSPEPLIPVATDILFDAWALTSIRGPLPGRPSVAPYLHGVADWEPAETTIAWREEVSEISGDLLPGNKPEDLLEDFPLLPHELLRDRSDRVHKQLAVLAKRRPDAIVWVVDDRGGVTMSALSALQKDEIEYRTVVLPPVAGGLSDLGLLDGGESTAATDVADDGADSRRKRIWGREAIPAGMTVVREIDFNPDADERDEERVWYWCERATEGGNRASNRVTWADHVAHVVDFARRIVDGLELPDEVANAVVVAAQLHDHGKRRPEFQLTLGNSDFPNVWLAKSGRSGNRQLPEPYRHEFGSVLEAGEDAEFAKLSREMQELVLHIIAAHHGRARPHFGWDEAFDPARSQGDAEALSLDTPRRFARLQRKYGRWGLAYLESLLRAADWAASKAESEVGV